MLKKPITYTNFNDEEVTENFYFNLNEAEIIEWEHERPGGFAQWLQEIAQMKDNHEILAAFKRIILMGVGEKSEDGKHFVKNEEIRKKFEAHAAFPKLYMEMLQDSDKAVEFFQAVIPKSAAEQFAKGVEEAKALEKAKASAGEGAS